MTRGKAKEIAGYLRGRLAAGEYDREGQRPKLPTVRDLATEFDTTRATVDRAIRMLEAGAVVEVIQGSGIYGRLDIALERDLDESTRSEFRRAKAGQPGPSFEEMTGANPVKVDPEYDWRPPPEPVAALLHLPPHADVLVRTFRYAIKGVPHQVARSYLPIATANAAGLTSPDRERPGVGTINYLLDAGVDLGFARRRMRSRLPSPDEIRELSLPPGTDVNEPWRILYTRGANEQTDAAVEVSMAVVRADQVVYVWRIDFEEDPS